MLYDHQIFSSQTHGGISRYFTELAKHIQPSSGWMVRIFAGAHVNAYLDSLPSWQVAGLRVPALRKTGWIRQHVNDVITPAFIARSRPDLVHETYYSLRGSAPREIPTVVTVYDMIHETYPHYFARAELHAARKAATVRRAAHVICISQSTRDDLLSRIELDPAKVSVVHLASYMTRSTTETSAVPSESKPYLLYVGQRSGHKNFIGFLKALATRRQILADFDVRFFGGGPLTRVEQETLTSLRLPQRHFLSAGTSDDDLPGLYRGAAALVYPSLYEGFGLPILEAMEFGCPVICGRSSSLPEVAGLAAEFCDPTEPSDLADAILRVTSSKAVADSLRKAGLERVRSFTWEKTAKETVAIYTSVIERSQ